MSFFPVASWEFYVAINCHVAASVFTCQLNKILCLFVEKFDPFAAGPMAATKSPVNVSCIFFIILSMCI